MSQELTDKTWFIVTISHVTKNVTKDEAEQITEAFERGKDAFVLSDATVIPRVGTVICSNEDYQIAERRKRGDWMCKYGTWHSRKEATYDCMCGRAH